MFNKHNQKQNFYHSRQARWASVTYSCPPGSLCSWPWPPFIALSMGALVPSAQRTWSLHNGRKKQNKTKKQWWASSSPWSGSIKDVMTRRRQDERGLSWPEEDAKVCRSQPSSNPTPNPPLPQLTCYPSGLAKLHVDWPRSPPIPRFMAVCPRGPDTKPATLLLLHLEYKHR